MVLGWGGEQAREEVGEEAVRRRGMRLGGEAGA